MDILDELVKNNISQKNEVLLKLLNSLEEHQAFQYADKTSEKNMLSFIHEHLNKSSTRLKGIFILSKFVKQCSQEAFIENVNFWITSCLRNIENSKNFIHKDNFIVLDIIINKCSNIPELNKVINNIKIWKIVEHLKTFNPINLPMESLKLIESMLLYYGPQCTNQKANLENFLFAFIDLDESQEMRVKAAGNCVALLSLAGSRISEPNQDRWMDQQIQFIFAIHQFLDQIFEGILEIQQFHRPESAQPLSKSLESFIKGKDSLLECFQELRLQCPSVAEHASEESSIVFRTQRTVTKLINLLTFFKQFLRKKFPKFKSFHPEMILGIISRILSVTPFTLGSTTSDKLAVGSILPELHQKAYKLIQELIKQCRRSLIPWSQDICQIIIHTVKWTCDKTTCRLAYSRLRLIAYETLNLWQTISKNCPFIEKVQDQLIPYFLADIYIPRQSVKISARNLTLKKHLSKKERKQRKQILSGESEQNPELNEELNRIKLIDPKDYELICIGALQSLQTLLRTNGDLIQLHLLKQIQQRVFGLIFEMINNEPPFPYSIASCRRELIALMQVCAQVSHPAWPAPISSPLAIFTEIKQNNLINGMDHCYEILTHLIHPSRPSLEFPILRKDCLAAYDEDDEEEDSENDEIEMEVENKQQPEQIEEMPEQMENLSQNNQINGELINIPEIDIRDEEFEIVSEEDDDDDIVEIKNTEPTPKRPKMISPIPILNNRKSPSPILLILENNKENEKMISTNNIDKDSNLLEKENKEKIKNIQIEDNTSNNKKEKENIKVADDILEEALASFVNK